MNILAALALITLGALPFLLQGQTTPPWIQSARRVSPVPLGVAPAPLDGVELSKGAAPVDPFEAPASLPSLDSSHMAALVAAEDLRVRILLHHANRMIVPEVIPVRGGLPTLVLPGPGTYTIADLVSNGAVVPLTNQGGYLLVDSVLVGSGASLKLGGAGLPNLLMDSSASGFTSLVTWGGSLSLAGDSAEAPLAITGWDRARNQAAADNGYGRPYIRAVGGQLDLKFVNASSLGFWSGRTGGVAWTGISSRVSTGSAISSRFIGNTYGSFVSRASKVQFRDDLFEGNELDGLRLHRGAVGSIVTDSAAARNGGNGFVVSRGATEAVLKGNLALHNQGNGFLIDGQPLVSGASPSGSQAVVSVGTVVEDGDAEDNLRTGILVEGGSGTLITGNIVCGPVTGIAIRAGAAATSVVGNQVRCGGRIALSIGPAVTGTTVSGNSLADARIGVLVRNSAGVRIMYNRITGMSIFGISVRGLSPGVVGNDNLITGRGFDPIDTRSGADTPTLTSTDISGWQHRSQLSLLSYSRYHPILTTWLAILFIGALLSVVARLRRRTPLPYHYTAGWQPASRDANGARPAVAAVEVVDEVAVPVRKRVIAHGASSRRVARQSSIPIVRSADQ